MSRGKAAARKAKNATAPSRQAENVVNLPKQSQQAPESDSDSEIELADIGTKDFFQKVLESSGNESDASEQSVKEEAEEHVATTKDDSIRKFEIKSQARVALKALQKYRKENNKNFLFPELDESVYFVIKYKKPALKGSMAQRRFIQLPCTDRNPDNTSICLILPDIDLSEKARKDPDVDKQAREWADKLLEEYGITPQDVAKILTFRQLQREYSQPADKFKLSNAYDIFLVDSAVLKITLNFLGSNFRKPGKMPLPINANHKSVVKQIAKAYRTVNFSTEPLKDAVSVRIGHLGQSIADLSENLNEVVDRAAEYAPGGLLNFRACYIQTSDTSVSLPVFADFGSANEVELEAYVEREYAEEEDECSTLPEGLAVKVRADGQVVVIDAKTKEEVLYPTMDDEWEEGDDIQPLNIEKIVKKKVRQAKRKRTTDAKQQGRIATTKNETDALVEEDAVKTAEPADAKQELEGSDDEEKVPAKKAKKPKKKASKKAK